MTEIDFSKGIVMPNFSNYVVFPEEGKIWSKPRKGCKGGWVGAPNVKGYWYIAMYGDDGCVWRSEAQRVIWTAVYGDIPEGLQVNHIDEDKSNNSISNLNLMTPKENVNWGTGIERRTEKQRNDPNRSKQVAAYEDGVLVMVFPSAKEAGRNGFDSGHVSACCNGKLKSHKNYQWLYYVDSPPLFYIAA